jgi:ribosome biogenesis GTPase A
MRNKSDVYKVTTLVGFIGKNNVGKTHIINQLIGSNYQSHYYCRTKGICFKLPIK